ncbi:hypothetical protein AUJ61_03160 [Candidatus Pacearchaeota archaeon CG1_02_30_18]|nr:MAG: hypothetical protein QJ16_C0005G0075 [archaeon GW2011_AR1]NCO18095.1 hypothetical protein [Candidatus Pacearchaeota archaeon]OIO39908.1 MAG: hypothetical protein AUJ61_03160 [Candidatus Pacearchaeota archaeon CG1_02_30_18]PIN71387.1 MAG: hypothetical protein COV77_02225 [Candidatus Pacearchaeota archaeon CG11_big_fil_rev_8_21_14_0_20_30_13]PIZ81995.1 MAG: hypothetical protein COX98_01445 [Candidatus Pacearchaeota archaeon CG_4_10_14_0_2_um_filter_30_11]PJA71113.1 MAG: hypothetical prot
MGWLIDFSIQMKEVFLSLGILLLVISYFKDNFNYFGAYYIIGILVLAFSIALYLVNFFKKL